MHQSDRLVLSNATRSGILGLTKTLTRRVDELAKSDAERAREAYDAVIVERTSDIPLRRLAKAEEIANLVVFLTSEKASYTTGAAIQIDGGLIKSLI